MEVLQKDDRRKEAQITRRRGERRGSTYIATQAMRQQRERVHQIDDAIRAEYAYRSRRALDTVVERADEV